MRALLDSAIAVAVLGHNKKSLRPRRVARIGRPIDNGSGFRFYIHKDECGEKEGKKQLNGKVGKYGLSGDTVVCADGGILA